MSGTDQWAGGPDDRERKRLSIEGKLNAADFWLSDDPWEGPRTKIDEVNDSAGVWGRAAASRGFEHVDPASDAEAFALPAWGERLAFLRSLGLPIQRVRSLARGQDEGTAFECLCVCDADDDGNVLPIRIWVLRQHGLPDLACEAGFGELPDARTDLWGCDLSGYAHESAVKDNEPVVKGGRLAKSRLGRAVVGKLNDFLDNARWTRIYTADRAFARAVAERFTNDRALWDHNAHWMIRGPVLIYVTPDLNKGVPHAKAENPVLTFLNAALTATASAQTR